MKTFTSMRVLIVDDSEDMCMSTKRLLEGAGYSDVRIALSVRQAFSILGVGNRAAAAPTVDGILMDVTMPGVSGLEACRQIKADARLRDIPIIVVTGRAEEEVLEEAFAAGRAVGYAEGVRDLRHAQLAAAPPQEPIVFSTEIVINRTLVAALEYFRDTVLAANPEEVTTGEWLSAVQVTALIRQIQGGVTRG